MPKIEKCPVCGSNRHSGPLNIKVGEQDTYDYDDEYVCYPVTEEFVSCSDCGTLRVYWIDK